MPPLGYVEFLMGLFGSSAVAMHRKWGEHAGVGEVGWGGGAWWLEIAWVL